MPAPPPDPLAALTAMLRSVPSQPLVTFHDGATGERVELSVVTVENWVSKIANLLAGDLGHDLGATATVELPAHWQTAVSVLGVWAAGLTLVSPEADADVRIVGPQAVEAYDGGAQASDVVASALRPLGGRFTEPLPAGWLDFAIEVPPQPDVLVDQRPMAAAAVSWNAPLSAVDLMRQASAAAEAAGLEPGGRLMTDMSPATPNGLVGGLCACLGVAGSLVLVTNTSQAAADRLSEQERVTCRIWSQPKM